MSEQGFVIVQDLLTPSQTAALRAEVASMRRSRAGARMVLDHPAVRSLAEDDRLVSLASALLGGSARAFKATLFDKSREANWLVTWHQDLALPVRSRVEAPGWGPWTEKGGQLHAIAPAQILTGIVALRVHLDDSTSENGPLRVLPDTHRRGRLSPEQIAAFAREKPAVECVVRTGGVIAMRPLLLHASSKSISPLPRRVLHLEYATGTFLGSGIELAVG